MAKNGIGMAHNPGTDFRQCELGCQTKVFSLQTTTKTQMFSLAPLPHYGKEHALFAKQDVLSPMNTTQHVYPRSCQLIKWVDHRG